MGFFNFRANRSIGIDLGTANTLVYSKKHKKIVLNEPSVVAVEKETKKVLAVGNEAREMLGKTPDTIVAVKPLSEGVIADYDITEAMIKYFIKKIFGSYSFFMPEIMICVPIDVTGVEKRAVLEAAISAGAKKGDRTAEEIKIKIGTALPLEEEETIEVKGRDLLMGLPKVITITSEEVREAIKDSLDQILQCIRTVLEKTPPELAADIVDKGMMMTGGGSLIRNFPEMITKYTNLKVNLAENPLESVVIGAGLALDQIDVLRKIEKAER